MRGPSVTHAEFLTIIVCLFSSDFLCQLLTLLGSIYSSYFFTNNLEKIMSFFLILFYGLEVQDGSAGLYVS